MEITGIKINEFIRMDIDIDVVDDVEDDFCIAFCGPLELTDEGAEHFSEVLEYPCIVLNQCAVVRIDFADWKRRLRLVKEFFCAAAGYCLEEDYERWFVC